MPLPSVGNSVIDSPDATDSVASLRFVVVLTIREVMFVLANSQTSANLCITHSPLNRKTRSGRSSATPFDRTA